MSVAIVVQARMTSERLPGKVMKKVLEKPLLEFLLERLLRFQGVDLIVATTENEADQQIVDQCELMGVKCVRGSKNDVLTRYLQASEGYDIVVRVTGDCPLIDPEIVREAIEKFLRGEYDFVSNTFVRTYPRGMDVEVMSRDLLEDLNGKDLKPSEREHVTLYIQSHADDFSIGQIAMEPNRSDVRLTVDTEEDFELIQRILEHLYKNNPHFRLADIMELLEEHSEWLELNRQVKQKDQHG